MDIINELHDIGYSKLAIMIQKGEISSANKAFGYICNDGPTLDRSEAIQASRRAITLVTSYYDRNVENAKIIIVSNYKLDQNNNISIFKIGHISVRPVSFLVALTASNNIVSLADKEDDLDMRQVEILDAVGRVLYSDDIELKKD